jgi:hypothetical protein
MSGFFRLTAFAGGADLARFFPDTASAGAEGLASLPSESMAVLFDHLLARGPNCCAVSAVSHRWHASEFFPVDYTASTPIFTLPPDSGCLIRQQVTIASSL